MCFRGWPSALPRASCLGVLSREMVNPELKEELLSNDSLDVLVGTRFSSVRAGPVNSAVVLNSKQYWVCDIKGYGPIQCIMFHAQPFNFVRLGTVRHLLHSVPIINLF